MRRIGFIILSIAALTTGQRAGLAAGSGPAWLHVRVEEPRRQSKVHLNLPLPVVEAALKATPERMVSEGKIHLNRSGKDLSVSDLRRVWKELRDTGDTDLVTIEEKDEQVSIARRGNQVEIRVEQPKGRKQVHVDLPVAVVDAFLSGEGEAVDIRAALAELGRKRGDIVRVDDGDSIVHVWIDEGK